MTSEKETRYLPNISAMGDHLLDRIAKGRAILLNDSARPGERLVARRWRKRRPEFEFWRVKGGAKGALIGRRVHA